jgi:biopolymer transport protein ExbB/TolQ
MTGDDLLWWLEALWYDITNPGQANVFFLVFRVAVVYVFAWFFWNILKSIYKSLQISFFWRVRRFATAPQRWVRNRKKEREWRQEQEEAKRRQAQIEEQSRLQEEERRAHEREMFEKIMKTPPASRRKR